MMQQVEDINKKWKAIYIALLNYFDPDDAAEATNVWLNEFSDKPTFELNPFITKISNKYNLKISRKEIQQSMVKFLLMDKNEFISQDTSNFDISSKIKFENDKVAHVVFVKLIKQWLNEANEINKDMAAGIRQFIYDSLTSIGMNYDDIIKIKRWINTKGRDDCIQDFDIKELRQITHFCYIGSCEYMGPVVTDKIVAEIILLIEGTQEGVTFSPKNFF